MTDNDDQARQVNGRMALLGRLAPSGEAVVRALRAAALALALVYVVVLVAVVALRVGYDYELGWQEGAMEDHVRRVLDGEPLYGPPSLAFTPFIYPPLYHYAGALAARVLGLSLLTLRLVSVLATLVCAGLLYALARREGARRRAAWLAVGLFAAAFEVGGAWYDLARVDMLLMALVLGAVYVLRRWPSAGGYVAAGVLLTLAFLTKQTALILAGPLLLYAVWADPRRGWLLGLALLVGVGGSTLLLDAQTGGWYRYYVFELPRQHTWVGRMAIKYWSHDLFRPMAAGLLLAALYLGLARREGRAYGFWVMVWGGALAASWLLRLHSGGYANVLIPAYVVTALLFALGVDAVERRAARMAAPDRALVLVGLYAAVLVQLAALVYNPLDYVPRRADAEAGAAVVARLAASEGPVYLPAQGYLAERAGHDAGAHEMALYDVLRTENAGRRRLQAEIDEAMAAQRYRLVVVPQDDHGWLGYGWLGLDASYRVVDTLSQSATFLPVPGAGPRVDHVYAPRRAEGAVAPTDAIAEPGPAPLALPETETEALIR